MRRTSAIQLAWPREIGLLALAGMLLLALVSCSSPPKEAPGATPASNTPLPRATWVPNETLGKADASKAVTLKQLKIEPVTGYVGEPFTIRGEGLPPNKEVDFIWVTAEGFYVTKAGPENVEFHEKQFREKRVSLGKVVANAQGEASLALKAPEDYGEVHDIYAEVDGEAVAKGGFRILRNVTISPTEGPIGTPITVKVTGLGWKTYESTVAVRYDNQFTGIGTAVTTNGTAMLQIRAAGRIGKHVIDVNHGAKSVPYLNNQQSGTAHIPDFRVWFTVTDDKALPEAALEWPDPNRLAKLDNNAAPRTTTSGVPTASGVSAALEPASGPILSQTTMRATGLTPNAEVELFWVTARGNRVSPSGWSLEENSLLKVTSDRNGTIAATFEIPDDLGGWHVVKLVQTEQVLAEVPFFVERSLMGVTPVRVKAGEVFTVQVKGVGWTELDNGVAVTYDNAFIGFACGFNSRGDVTMNLIATGAPGIHLIDLYPMIYQGHGKPPWGYQVPILSFKEDAPGLGLGYNLPALRLAIEVIE